MAGILKIKSDIEIINQENDMDKFPTLDLQNRHQNFEEPHKKEQRNMKRNQVPRHYLKELKITIVKERNIYVVISGKL